MITKLRLVSIIVCQIEKFVKCAQNQNENCAIFSQNARLNWSGVGEEMCFSLCEYRNWGWCQQKNVFQFLRMQKLGVVSSKKCVSISGNAEIKGCVWWMRLF